MRRHLHGADVVLYILSVEECVRTAGLPVEAEADVDIPHLFLQLLFTDCSVGMEETVTHRIERHRTVHRPCIDIDVADFLCQIFCHRTFPAGGEAVDGDGYFLHCVLFVSVLPGSRFYIWFQFTLVIFPSLTVAERM